MEKLQLVQILKGQKDLYVRPGDKILFIVDESYGPELHSAIYEVFGREGFGKNMVLCRIATITKPGQDYELEEYLLDGVTLAWLITAVSISHSPASKRMMDRGIFIISNPGITPDWAEMLSPANSRICKERADKLIKIMGGDIGGKINIFDRDGTDLVLRVPNGNWEKEFGSRTGVGTNGLFGELFTAPYHADGMYVLKDGDFATNPINMLSGEIIRLTIKNNMVVDIEGEGRGGKKLKELLAAAGKSEAYSLGEFAIQLNPGRPWNVSRSVVAEKIEGGIHIAIGTNMVCLKADCPDIAKFPFGRYNAGVHIDCIKYGASVIFTPEGGGRWEVLMRDGKFEF